jgi:riboflavin synthase
LPISGIGDDYLMVDIIPTTASETTLGNLKVGDMVNLEGDVVGKYVAKQVKAAAPTLTEASLIAAGFMN